jgi:hypothetical protein
MKGLLDILIFGRFFKSAKKKSLLVALLDEIIDYEVVNLAVAIAKNNKLGIVLVHTMEISRDYPIDADLPNERKNGWKYIRYFEALFKSNRCKVEYSGLIMARDAGVAVTKEALVRDVEIIMVGLPYKHRQGTYALGTTVSSILKNAYCEVLVVRQSSPNKIS